MAGSFVGDARLNRLLCKSRGLRRFLKRTLHNAAADMKILLRLIPFARPLYHFIPEYIVYTLLGILFGLLNFALLIPVMDLLFNNPVPAAAPLLPEFSVSLEYFKSLFNHHFYSIIISYGKFRALLFVCGIIGISILLSNVLKYMAVKVLIRLRLKLMEGVRNELFRTYMHQGLRYHNNNTTGESIMVMTTEVQEIEISIVNSLQVLLRDPLVVVAYFGLLMYWSPQLTFFTLVFLPVSGLAITAITRKLKRLNYFSQDMMSRMLSVISESLGGIRQIQSFTAEKVMEGKFREVNRKFSVNSKSLFGKKELASPISEVLGVLSALVLILFAGYLIIHGRTELTGNGFIAYLALYTQMIQPLKNISQTSGNIQRGIAACERIFAVMDAPSEIRDKPDATVLGGFEKSIHIRDVSFAYEQMPVIRNFSLQVEKGRKIALVGPSGSGKSTLIDLISRYYDVQQGKIEIDGYDVRDLQLRSLRSHISIVSQNAVLFNDTISNNIAFGNTHYTQEEIEQAARVANAHEFILQTTEGYDTVVGETGVKLSGGQRQRITIARAILKNAPILILDEATSSLDTESEKLVQHAIDKMVQDRTSIIIAHRLSTIRHADEIIVMNRGEIAERGTHTTLLEKGGIYKKLIEMQEVR
jgi:subfamily B ATP-binding cassette protein MsbA